MKQIRIFTALFIMILMGMNAKAQTYEKLWEKVEEAQKESLPKTAIEFLNKIYHKASTEDNMPQMLKAFITKAQCTNEITTDSFRINLKQLEQWEASIQQPVDKAILNSIISSTYTGYYDRNYFQFANNNQIVNEAPSEDIQQWSSNQVIDAILKRGLASLQPKEELFKTSTRKYIPFAIEGNASKYYHHNLYQLLATRFINQLKSSNIAHRNKIIEDIYQQLFQFYTLPAYTEAKILTQLDYLNWKGTDNIKPLKTIESNKQLPQSAYLLGLDSLIHNYAKYEVCAEAYFAKAEYAQQYNHPAVALELCNEAIRQYPHYTYINKIRNLRDGILQPTLGVKMPTEAYPNSTVDISVNFKCINEFTIEFFNGKKSVSKEVIKLTPTSDYRVADTLISIKTPGLGEYAYVITPTGESKTEQLKSNKLYITRFNLIYISLPNNEMEVIALDAKSGHPIADATIEVYNYKDKLQTSQQTNKDGVCVISKQNEYRNMKAIKENDSFMPQKTFYGSYNFNSSSSKLKKSVQLITDRSIYRPGQTVYIKGIAYSQSGDTASVITNEKYTLKLIDANRQEVNQKELVTNDFGSFTTEFVLPSDCLNGTFAIITENGFINIEVQDYKLPTFEISFDKTNTSYKLGETVELKGKAQMLNGVPMQDVEVAYTIIRQTLRWWWRGSNENGIIETGKAELNESGHFTIPVELLVPDNDNNPYYSYIVKASITSLSGETQTNYYTINAGKSSMMLNLNANERICKENILEMIIQATNLDRQPIATNGTYQLYSLSSDGSVEKALKTVPVFSGTFIANQPISTAGWSKIASGNYVIQYCAKDSQNQDVCDNKTFTLFSIDDKCPPVYTDKWLYIENDTFDASHPAIFYYGTSQQDAYIMMKVFSGNKLLESRTFNLSNSIERFEFPYKEQYGDGLTIRICYLKDNKLYETDINIKKRLHDKNLNMKWDVFRDKLRPGQKEEWKLTIKTPQNRAANAEMLALMYDSALDQIYPYNQKLGIFYNQILPSTSWNRTHISSNYYAYRGIVKSFDVKRMVFDTFINTNIFSINYDNVVVAAYGIKNSLSGAVPGVRTKSSGNEMLAASRSNVATPEISFVQEQADANSPESIIEVETLNSDMGSLRTNFNETAFFYPQLRTNEQGEVSFSFTMPESLTRWSFHGFAHTTGMLVGNMEASATTSKEFMLMPNMPRFVRVNDVVTISATISNLTNKEISGTASMTLFNPTDDKVMSTQKTPFTVQANQTTAVSFSFKVSDKYEILGCRMIADGGSFSDGEQRLIPVLSDKIHLTESVAMPIRGNETHTFSLQDLFNQHSQSATNRSLTVEFTGNPTWYAVQALPSIANTQDKSATGYASAFYANSLASWIVGQQPRIKTIFETWKKQGGDKETLLSNLEKNQELKNIILSESPWVMEAKTEQEQKERIATLFDLNNIQNNNASIIKRLKELQLPDGSWSWYKGMSGSAYTTQYIVELNARLSALTGNALSGDIATMQTAAMGFLKKEITDEYKEMIASERKNASITNLALRYLYISAISKNDVVALDKNIYNYLLSKVNNYLTSGTMEQKAMAAIILNNANRKSDALKFMASIKEHLSQTNEMGMFFDFNTNPFSWGGLQLPAHVMVMEAFNTVTNDLPVVNEMKLWLLKQKQTQAWNSPVASTNAIYALLMRGDDLLNNQGDVSITIGNETIKTNAKTATPGLGYMKEVYTSPKVIDTKKVTVTKHDNGIGWGAVYAQYQEDVNNVKQYGKEMNIEKQLYVQRIVNNEKQISPITSETQLAVGDVVVSRLVLTLDRTIDFIQLNDQRAACFEPVSSISGYKWSNGFSYYMDIKDASTSFFFDQLSKGVYIIEYNYYVDRIGEYQSGIATIQSAYAPEFSSHSNSYQIKIAE